MNKIKLEQEKIFTDEEYGLGYKYYGMKYTLTFEEGYNYEEKINEIKSKIPFHYTLVQQGNTFKIKPKKGNEKMLKNNFRKVQKRKREYETRMQRQMQRQMQEQREMVQENQRKRRWTERKKPEQRKRRWTERKKPEQRKRRWPMYDNLLALKF